MLVRYIFNKARVLHLNLNMIGLALRLVKKSTHRQHHHAAIITRGGAVVSVGYNKGSTHAEAMALRKCKYKHNLTLFSFRFTKGGKWAMARPCHKCAKLLEGVKVWYTDEQGTLVRMNATRPMRFFRYANGWQELNSTRWM